MGVIIRNGISYTPSQISTLDELPLTGVDNQIYIVDGNSYCWDSDNQSFSQINTVIDGVTIKKNQAGALTAVGADVSGNSYTIDGTTYTAGTGAIIFSDYSNNKNAGSYSSIFGNANNNTSTHSIVNGSGNKIIGKYCNNIIGYGNNVESAFTLIVGSSNGQTANEITSESVKFSHGAILGSSNKFTHPVTDPYDQGNGIIYIFGCTNILSGAGDFRTIFGGNNTVSDCTSTIVNGQGNTTIYNNFGLIFGQSNNVSLSLSDNAQASYTTVIGISNTISIPKTFVYGENNSIIAGSKYVTFGSNNIFNGTCSSVVTFGNYNRPINTTDTYIFGNSNGYSANLVNLSRMFIAGDSNTFNGNYLQDSYIFGSNNSLQGAGIGGLYLFGSGNTFYGTNTSSTISIVIGNTNSTTYSCSFNNSLIFGKSNSSTGNFQDSIMIGMENSNTASTTFSQIIGNRNTVNGGNYITVIGQNNTIDSGATRVFTFGYGNTVGNINQSLIFGNSNSISEEGYYFGDNLNISSSSNTPFSFVIGKYNDTTITDSIFTIANGTSNARADILRMSATGLLQLCGSTGNAVTVNGETIESTRQTLSSMTTTTTHTFAVLPTNGQETVLSTTAQLTSITITDITRMSYDNGRGAAIKAVSDEYNSVLIFKKDSTIQTASDLLTNFTSQTANKIYLLNPDLDISSYTIIHIMLFNDGFNICAIIAGYEEVAPL